MDESVLGLLGSIYENVSASQQRNYDEAIEELREEVRGCAKEFAMMQDLFIQAIRAKLNPDSAEVDTTLLQELQGRVKKEEWHIMKRELQALLEKGVVLEVMGEQEKKKGMMEVMQEQEVVEVMEKKEVMEQEKKE